MEARGCAHADCATGTARARLIEDGVRHSRIIEPNPAIIALWQWLCVGCWWLGRLKRTVRESKLFIAVAVVLYSLCAPPFDALAIRRASRLSTRGRGVLRVLGFAGTHPFTGTGDATNVMASKPSALLNPPSAMEMPKPVCASHAKLLRRRLK